MCLIRQHAPGSHLDNLPDEVNIPQNHEVFHHPPVSQELKSQSDPRQSVVLGSLNWASRNAVLNGSQRSHSTRDNPSSKGSVAVSGVRFWSQGACNLYPVEDDGNCHQLNIVITT